MVEKNEHQAVHEVSLDPSQLGTAVCEADCMRQCQNLAVLTSDASLSDTLYLWLMETDTPENINDNYI